MITSNSSNVIPFSKKKDDVVEQFDLFGFGGSEDSTDVGLRQNDVGDSLNELLDYFTIRDIQEMERICGFKPDRGEQWGWYLSFDQPEGPIYFPQIIFNWYVRNPSMSPVKLDDLESYVDDLVGSLKLMDTFMGPVLCRRGDDQ